MDAEMVVERDAGVYQDTDTYIEVETDMDVDIETVIESYT